MSHQQGIGMKSIRSRLLVVKRSLQAFPLLILVTLTFHPVPPVLGFQWEVILVLSGDNNGTTATNNAATTFKAPYAVRLSQDYQYLLIYHQENVVDGKVITSLRIIIKNTSNLLGEPVSIIDHVALEENGTTRQLRVSLGDFGPNGTLFVQGFGTEQHILQVTMDGEIINDFPVDPNPKNPSVPRYMEGIGTPHAEFFYDESLQTLFCTYEINKTFFNDTVRGYGVMLFSDGLDVIGDPLFPWLTSLMNDTIDMLPEAENNNVTIISHWIDARLLLLPHSQEADFAIYVEDTITYSRDDNPEERSSTVERQLRYYQVDSEGEEKNVTLIKTEVLEDGKNGVRWDLYSVGGGLMQLNDRYIVTGGGTRISSGDWTGLIQVIDISTKSLVGAITRSSFPSAISKSFEGAGSLIPWMENDSFLFITGDDLIVGLKITDFQPMTSTPLAKNSVVSSEPLLNVPNELVLLVLASTASLLTATALLKVRKVRISRRPRETE